MTFPRILILLALLYPTAVLMILEKSWSPSVLLLPLDLLEIAASAGFAAFLVTILLFIGLMAMLYFGWKYSSGWLAAFLISGGTFLTITLLVIRSL